MGWRSGCFCLAHLRPDGFAGYEQIAGGSNKTATAFDKDGRQSHHGFVPLVPRGSKTRL